MAIQPEQVAFLGLGAMGFGMATNLLTKPQYTTTGFDIWAPTLSRFLAAGGLTSSKPIDAVRGKKFIIVMVATALQVQDVLFTSSAVEVLEPNAVIILMSTGPPGYTLDVERQLAERGRKDVLLIDAPVSGGTARAANGTLTILASGSEEALKAGRGLLDVMSGGLAADKKGGNLWLIPGGLGKGTEVKMVHQVLAAIGITLASEVLGFVAKLGLNTRKVFDRINKGEGWNWMVENRGAHTFEKGEEFEGKVYSALNIMVKDIGIITSTGRSVSFPLFLSSTTEQVLFSGVSAGYGLEDDSKLFRVYLPQQHSLILDQSSPSFVRPTNNGTNGTTTSKSSHKTPEEEEEAAYQLIENLLKAVNLAAAVEALSLSKHLGLELQTLWEIIKGAAGGSWVFTNRIPDFISGEYAGKAKGKGKTVGEVVGDLKKAVEAAHALKYPLHLTGTTLQLFQLAELRGWGAENELAVGKIWEK